MEELTRERRAEADRRGARRADRQSLRTDDEIWLLLAVDCGNTQTVFGLYDGDRLTEQWRVATEPTRTEDELGTLIGDLVDLGAVSGVCLSSTVPSLIRGTSSSRSAGAKAPLLAVGPGVRTGIAMRHDAPHEVGPDRIVNSVAAKERCGAPCIVVDFGRRRTSTSSRRRAST